jgi:hypothetical protein
MWTPMKLGYPVIKDVDTHETSDIPDSKISGCPVIAIRFHLVAGYYNSRWQN